MQDAFEKMDRMYRHQRYFYDLTRKYYLLGRDTLIRRMKVAEGESVLEVGCGTGRNLAMLAKRHPNASFFGLDASSEMLRTAENKLHGDAFPDVTLANALADEFSFAATFGRDARFDKIFFSYSISMIPTWQEAVDNALENLEEEGFMYFVDFYDQRDLPASFRKLLRRWLRKFHVKYPKDLIPYLEKLESNGSVKVSVESIYKSYSFIAVVEKSYQLGGK